MTLDEFLARTSRYERYRFANKSLRFFAYRWMENYVLASFVVSLVLPWTDDSLARTLILGMYGWSPQLESRITSQSR